MPIEVTPVVVNATIAEPAAEAAPAPEPVAVAESLEAVKDARYAAQETATSEAAAQAEAKAAADAVAAAETAKQKEAETVTAATLAAKLAETEAKAAALSDKAKRAEVLEQAEGLAKAGKHYEAIQLFASIGIDFDKAVHNVLNPGAAPEPAKPADQKPPVTEEVAKLQAELKAVQERLAASDKAVAEAAKENGRRSVVEHVKAKAIDYPFLASNEQWVTEALSAAEPEYAKALEANKGIDITEEAKNQIIINALAAAEAKHKATADAYAKIKTTNKPTNVSKQVTPAALTFTGNRAGTTPAPKAAKPATIDELKRQRRAN